MIRRFFALLLTLCLAAALIAGCGANAEPPPFLSNEEVPVRAVEPLELGEVQIVLPAPHPGSGGPPMNEAMEERMKSLLEQRIRAERNIGMDLHLLWQDNPREKAAWMAGSGDPAEMVYLWEDIGTAEEPLKAITPAALDDAIAAYGPNLLKMPVSELEPCRVDGKLLGLPMILWQDSAPMLNRRVLESYGWPEPKTLEELTTLLEAAKAAGLQPITNYASNTFAVLEPAAYRGGLVLLLEDGTLQPLHRRERFRQAVDFVKGWQDAGYFPPEDQAPRGTDYLANNDWLLSNASIAEAIATPGADLLPVALRGEQGLVLGGSTLHSSPVYFVAGDKPEAMVTLMDWAMAKSENHLLLAYGEEGVDYRPIDENRVEKLNKPVFCFTQFLSATWRYPLPQEKCERPAAIGEIRRAIAAAESMRSADQLVSLPRSTLRYAQPNSTLALAWAGIDRWALRDIAEKRITLGVGWDALEAPEDTEHGGATLAQVDEHTRPYLALLDAYLNGSYDPAVETIGYVPAP